LHIPIATGKNEEIIMKNRVARMLSIGFALAAAAAVQAQNNGVTADVPFNFYVGSHLMPQGAYRVGGVSNSGMAWLNATEKDAIQGFTTSTVIGKKTVEPARLVFHRYGEEYFLSEIWTGSGSIGKALNVSAREKELSGAASPTLSVVRVALHR
jgi:hypothetical protein